MGSGSGLWSLLFYGRGRGHAGASFPTPRVEGDNRSGIAARLTRKIADAGVNLRGLSAAVIGERFVAHLAFDSDEDASKAMEVLHAE